MAEEPFFRGDKRRGGEGKGGKARDQDKCILCTGNLRTRLHPSKDPNLFQKLSFKRRVSENECPSIERSYRASCLELPR